MQGMCNKRKNEIKNLNMNEENKTQNKTKDEIAGNKEINE